MTNQYNLHSIEASYRNYLSINQISSVTIKNYLCDLRHFIGWYLISSDNDKIDLTIIFTTSSLNDYFRYLEDKHFSFKTIRRHVSSVRQFAQFCVTSGWLGNQILQTISSLTIGLLPNNKSALLRLYEKHLLDQGLSIKEIQLILNDINECIDFSYE